jgi:anti-anti-sigma regulatory factor
MSGHSCFIYEEQEQCRAVTIEYLADGLRRGERVGYFGWGDGTDVRQALLGFDQPEHGGSEDAVVVASLDDLYRRDVVPEPMDRLEFWTRATEESVAVGFDAFRVVTDTTPWLRLPDQRAAFLRSEYLLDRYTVDNPLTLMCVCDRNKLDGDAIDHVACIHSSTVALSPAFRVHATPAATFALDGEIDATSAPLLERLLADMDDTAAGLDLVIDAEQLTFVNHHGLFALERHAAHGGLRAVVVRRASASVAQLSELLDLQHVRTEAIR